MSVSRADVVIALDAAQRAFEHWLANRNDATFLAYLLAMQRVSTSFTAWHAANVERVEERAKAMRVVKAGDK